MINVSLIGPFVQDSGVIIEPIVSCSVPQWEWNRWNIWNKIGRLFSRPTPNRTHSVALSCSTCSACPTHSVERNGTRPMVWADRYGRSAPVTRESGQSQFAPPKLRSLALVPSSGAQSAPTNSTYGSSTVRLFLPRRSAPVRDSRSFRAPAPPVLMRGVSDGRNVLLVSGTVPLSGQPAAGLSPPGRCAPSRPIKGKRLRDSCRPHAAAACRCPCHRTPKAGKRLALESPLAPPQGEDNRPGSVVPRSTESAENP